MLDLNVLKKECIDKIKNSIIASYTGFCMPSRAFDIIVEHLNLNIVNCINDQYIIKTSDFIIMIDNNKYFINSFEFTYDTYDPYDENINYLKQFGMLGVKTGHKFAMPFMFT